MEELIESLAELFDTILYLELDSFEIQVKHRTNASKDGEQVYQYPAEIIEVGYNNEDFDKNGWLDELTHLAAIEIVNEMFKDIVNSGEPYRKDSIPYHEFVIEYDISQKSLGFASGFITV